MAALVDSKRKAIVDINPKAARKAGKIEPGRVTDQRANQRVETNENGGFRQAEGDGGRFADY
jgi:hypothetical protein